MSQKVWKIGVAGLGTVGGGLLQFLSERPDFAPAGGRAVVTGVSARSRSRPRSIDISDIAWFDDPVALATSPETDIFVELVGGSDGPAKAAVEAALKAGKPVVTANKALIAEHGAELAVLAEAAGVPLLFEAAVMGGTPAVKMLREAMVGDEVKGVAGILNGTCNFILSTMEDTGRDFADVLAEAQARGYAEADPAFDIEGVDAAHKLAILAAIAFGARIDFAAVDTCGISRLRAADIAQAHALGYVIRLIGIAETDAHDGTMRLFQRVQPHLVPFDHPLAHVDGATNAVVAEGNFSGRLLFQGAGAGDGPTASAVVADLIDIARGQLTGGEIGAPFSIPASELETLPPASPGYRIGRAYIRFLVADRPGVLAELTAAMRDAGVSIESLIQKGRAEGEGEVLVAMVTHEGPESAVGEALRLLEGSPSLVQPPLVMQILDN